MRYKTAANHRDRLSSIVRDGFAYNRDTPKTVVCERLQAEINKLPKGCPKWVPEYAWGTYDAITGSNEEGLNKLFKDAIGKHPTSRVLHNRYWKYIEGYNQAQRSRADGTRDWWTSFYYRWELDFLYILPEGTFSVQRNSQFPPLQYPNTIKKSTVCGHVWKNGNKGDWYSKGKTN